MADGLGQYAAGFASWRKMLASVEDVGVRWQIFGNAAHEIAGYVGKGLERAVAGDELHDIAVTYGLVRIDADSVQQIISDAFDDAQPEMVPDLEEQAINGYDRSPAGGPSPPPTRAKGFVLPDLSTMPRRALLYGGHYVRKVVTSTVAPGGWGKTTLALFEAVSMACEGLRVWYLSGEDPYDEIERRIAAHCVHHKINQPQIEGHLFVDDRASFPLVIAVGGRGGAVFGEDGLQAFEGAIVADQIDVVIIDPFVSFHSVPEIDNGAIDAVVKRLATIAARCNACIEISHHVRKAAFGQTELTVEDTRGGSAIVNAVRSCRVINRMSEREADLARVAYDKRSSYLRLDKGKRNMAPAEAATWYVLHSVHLPNGDNVQAVESWEFPSAFDGMTPTDVAWVQGVLGEGPRRTSSQSEDWLGHMIGARFSRDTTGKAGAIWANQVINKWLQNKVFKKATLRDPEQRKPFTYYVLNGYRSTTTEGATVIPFERPEGEDDDENNH